MAAKDETPEEQPGGGGIGSRLAGALSQGSQTVRRTSDVFTGADIRRFDEFTDAVTRVTVGLHRDQGELRDQVNDLEQSLSESRQAQAMRRGGKRLGRASAYSGIGTALAATGLGLAAIPVVMGLRVAENRVATQINLGDNLASRTAELGRLPTRT